VFGGVIVILNTTRITVKPENGNELGQTIGRLVEPARDIKGCRSFRFYLDAADENSLLLFSEWESEADLNNYLQSNTFAILNGAIKVLSLRSIEAKAFVTAVRNEA
jgi:quinol monooxygenase YgiN